MPANDQRPVVRSYRSSDLEAMFLLDEVCFEPRFRFSRAQMKRFAESRKARVLIAEASVGVAGFCILHVESIPRGGRIGYVVTLDVAPEARGLGFAQALMRQAEVEALDAGCVAMTLHVFSGNTDAIRFYERMGYVPSHSVGGFYGSGADAVVYHKYLAVDVPSEGACYNLKR